MKTVVRFGKSPIELAIRFTLELNMPLHGTTKDENGTQIFKMNADFILFPRFPRFPRPIFRTEIPVFNTEEGDSSEHFGMTVALAIALAIALAVSSLLCVGLPDIGHSE
ncbi:MAG: hypothetical protein DWQ04_07135 [Chloroflexi bacterium]|nr:MAG: hypothetical protein DWQ04_07135 [Chloroflexota bacterium]